jgi:mRNA interferase MazF
VIEQGDIWWLEMPDQKRRPCVVLTRNAAIAVLRDVLVAPVTTNARGLASEVALDAREGIPRPSVLNTQHVMSVPKGYLTRRIGQLAPGRWHEVCFAMRVAIGC